MSGKYKVPDRWEKYTNMGRIIPGTRFITFKVPLRQEIMQNVKNAGWFCPRTLLDHCHNMSIVIDLTDTFRYYDPEEFESRGVTHQKIRVRGRQIPEEKAVQKFYQAVNKFLEKNKENDKVIGVHCTHGINRSGYLVCRYMIQVLGIPPDQAIADFNSARGHEIERENYLLDLRQALWMNEAVPRYIKSTPTSKHSSEYPNSSLDVSTASLDTTNNTSLDTTTSEAESPRPSLSASMGRSWNIPLLKYPGGPEDESGSLPPVRRWSPVEERESRRSSRRTKRHNPLERNSSGDRDRSSGDRDRSSGDRDRSSRRHQERYSAYGARSYYDQIYQGRIAPQYDSHFYQQQGAGVGPHRAIPRYHRQQEQHQHQHQHHQGPSNAPRQYRGPRPYRSPPADSTTTRVQQEKSSDYFSSYRSPPAADTTTTPVRQRSSDYFSSYRSPPAADTTITPVRQEKSSDYFRTPDTSRTPRLRSHGPMRNPMSPGQREDVFSPVTPRRSARMTPY